MIIDIIYGIKIPQNLIIDLKENNVKEEIINKFSKRYIGVPVDDKNEFFPCSEMYFDQDEICSMKPEQHKIKIKVKNNTIERYENIKSDYLYMLCEEDVNKIANIVAYIHDTDPVIMFVAEDI